MKESPGEDGSATSMSEGQPRPSASLSKTRGAAPTFHGFCDLAGRTRLDPDETTQISVLARLGKLERLKGEILRVFELVNLCLVQVVSANLDLESSERSAGVLR